MRGVNVLTCRKDRYPRWLAFGVFERYGVIRLEFGSPASTTVPHPQNAGWGTVFSSS
ncbi:hypothetical protein [Rhodococcus sp. ABRD24]|uniref:hypothetical protein n=1 Tax=Rhodococcus sp. ABRD24 TaxID=2507582 RepID=UPI0013F1450D|nr:hypothetical protein [Rhodococcus sp. ABRD24]